MLFDLNGSSSDDPALARLIHAERMRMLLAPTIHSAFVSAIAAIALSLLIAPEVGRWPAGLWAGLCTLASAMRVLHLRSYLSSNNRGDPVWLNSLTWVCALHGSAWGLAGLLMPVQNMVTTSVVVATLVGACAVCTFTLQAHLKPNLALNVPMMLPAVVMMFTRQDGYGLFGGAGLLSLVVLLMFESRRSARRITELLWLRFTTDRIASERAEALKMSLRHSAVKDQFLATMSHEMRTPLHGILGLAQLVRTRMPSGSGALREARHQVELIERTGEHLLGIINDVLDFSRIEAGKLQVAMSPFDLQSTVEDVLSLLNVTATDKGLELITQVSLPAPCWVKGDAARLRQILHNLVGNAIKFTDTGEVRVHIRRSSEDPDRVVFQVDDTGPGIPAHQHQLIFEAFHQVDGSFGRRHSGTGLGLTISRELARAMGGDIVCTSVIDQGSCFTLTTPLPAAPVEQVDLHLTPDTADSTPNTAHAHSVHVLLAEDNPVNALVAQATLANLGVTVTHVEDGLQALAELQRPDHPYALVLMDCQMPGLDGIEATRRLRAWEHHRGRPAIPVIALTANAMQSDRDRCMAAGMNAHLAKPFRLDELRDMLRLHLPTKIIGEKDKAEA